MISDLDLAELQEAAYCYPDAHGVVTPFAWDWSATLKTKTAGFKVIGGVVVIILPGTQDPAQWEDDFTAFPRMTDHPLFGRVHAGFWKGIEAFCVALVLALPAGLPIIVIGHSMGAGEAPLIVAQLKSMGIAVARMVCFAPPRAGMNELADYIADIPKVLYCTVGTEAPGHDLVTDVPFSVPLLAPYCQVGPLTSLSVTPAANDPWILFKYHHVTCYIQGLERATARALS